MTDKDDVPKADSQSIANSVDGDEPPAVSEGNPSDDTNIYDQVGLSEYGKGSRNMLIALLEQTDGTAIQDEIVIAARESHRIPEEILYAAKERVDGQGFFFDEVSEQ